MLPPHRARLAVQQGRVVRRAPIRMPPGIAKPPYFRNGFAPNISQAPVAMFADQPDVIAKLRVAGKVTAQAREFAVQLVKPGRTTEELDRLLTEYIVHELKVYPSPINYLNFPKSLCTSINDVMVHGIPDDRELQDGDIVSLDVSCFVNGVHGDCCITVECGENVDEKAKKLVKDSRTCFEKCIAMCGPGVPIRNIGIFVDNWCAVNGYSPNKEFVGHGIGPLFHMQPIVANTRNDSEYVMMPGMAFTVEPIICEGSGECAPVWDDNWTIKTKDGSWAAQFEHTLLITDHGCDILTKI